MTEKSALGTRISPFAPHNPFLVRSRGLRASNVGVPMLDATNLGIGTTTDTSSGIVIYSATSEINSAHTALLVPYQVHLSHSAANATVRVSLELYNGPTTSSTPAFTVWLAEEDLSATADNIRCISQVATILFVPTSWTPGTRLLQVRCIPLTAGTLTVHSTATAYSRIAIFQLGAIDQ